ncbi:MAG: hypothetical protein GWO40_04690 [Gammaproteobacteria bacterium]|nr:hypothetical protein [Gemmatimonadota bacterium]NIR82448.1 hypothetical protein [Gammaproteobacteria bacterium]NIU03584.1 hypothetical protein [Gammaproteobacteria bacterium]NIX84858.1 hypothetical protein [Gammaproteobacteria bacterium]
MSDLGQRIREGAVTFLTLFASTGTLVCCALPITLVALGLGSAVVGLTGAAPWVVTLSRNKEWVFLVSGLLLVAGGWLVFRPGRTCPTDPRLGRLCTTLDRWNRRIYWSAVVIWGVGFFAAFLLLPLRKLMEGAAAL